MSMFAGTASLLSRLTRLAGQALGVCILLVSTTIFVPAQDAGGGAGGGGGASTGGSTGGTGGTGGTGSPGGTGGTGGIGGQPGSGNQGSGFPGGSPNGPFGGVDRMDPFANRPIYISGKVVLQEGGPAPVETVIELICNGQPTPEGYVNSKGEFNIQLGRDTQVMSDASTSSWGGRTRGGFQGPNIGMGGSRLTESDLLGCEVRASLPGFRSNSIQMAGRRVMDRPDIGTLVLTRLAKVEGLTISATTLKAPKTASKNYDKGIKELRNGKFEKALPHLEKAVAEYPEYAIAWHALGGAHEGLKQFDQAETEYQKALEADGKFVSPYLRLASLAANKQQWDKAEAFSATVIRLNPVDFAQAYYINAISNLQLQQFSKAEESAREAKKMDPSNRMPRLDYFLALILANRAKYQEAATLMKAYMKALPEDVDTTVLQHQLGQMEQMALSQQPAQNQ